MGVNIKKLFNLSLLFFTAKQRKIQDLKKISNTILVKNAENLSLFCVLEKISAKLKVLIKF